MLTSSPTCYVTSCIVQIVMPKHLDVLHMWSGLIDFVQTIVKINLLPEESLVYFQRHVLKHDFRPLMNFKNTPITSAYNSAFYLTFILLQLLELIHLF